MPKVVERFELAKILPGEGFNLDDEEALHALNRPLPEIQSFSGHDDTVSADLLPNVYASYQTNGITALEEENGAAVQWNYTADQVTFFETDDYLIRASLPVLMTAGVFVPEAFDQSKKEIR